MTGGSQQLRVFRRAIRDGASVDAAAELAGMSITEARLHAEDDAKTPPPPEAYELLGHNKGPNMANATDDRLRLLIERIEQLEEEKKGIAYDIKDVYAAAKAVGYDTKIMRQIVRLRKMDPNARAEMEALLDTYKAALGLDFITTPLGEATISRLAAA